MLTEVTVETLAQIVKSVFATMMELEVSVSESPWIPDGDRLTSFVLMTGEWTGAVPSHAHSGHVQDSCLRRIKRQRIPDEFNRERR